MGIRVKLGEYQVEEEWALSAKVLAAAGALAAMCLLGIAVHLVLGGGAGQGVALAMSPETHQAHDEPTGLVANDRGDVSRGALPAPRRSLETEVASPDWEDLEALKELRAMAAYEARACERHAEESADITRELVQQVSSGHAGPRQVVQPDPISR